MGSRSNIILRKIAVPALIPESVTDRSECAERVFSALHSLDYCIKNEPNNPLIRAQIVGDLVSDPIFHGLTADELNATVQSAVDRFVRMDPHRTYQSILFELFSSAFKSTIPGSAQPPWLDFDLFSGHLPRFYPIKSVNTEWAAYRHSSSSKTLSVKKTLIGHGSYQRVYQGLLWNEHTSIRVAVKMATINTLASDDPMETWAHSMLMLYNEQRILHYLHAQNSPYAVVPHLIGISALPGPRSVYKANYLNQLSLRFMSAVTMVDTTLSDYIPRVLNSKKDLLKSCFSSAIRAIIGIHTHHVFIGDCSVTNMGLQNTGSRKTIRIFDFNLATVTAGIQNPILEGITDLSCNITQIGLRKVGTNLIKIRCSWNNQPKSQ
ncbi:hypothetical protein EBR96_01870 [bacterium]|nr:hypothetical protein [bacterium]